ncbi:MAG: hypothetical protein ACWA6X_00195 [Bauldia sp.]
MNANAQQTFRKSMGPPRRIMRDFRLDEISAVDAPAQQHATARIMKAAGPTPISFATLDDAVAFLTKAGETPLNAMRKAAIDHPHLVERMNGQPSSHPTVAKSAADAAYKALDLAAQAIRSASPSMSRTAALSMAAQQNPALFKAARG